MRCAALWCGVCPLARERVCRPRPPTTTHGSRWHYRRKRSKPTRTATEENRAKRPRCVRFRTLRTIEAAWCSNCGHGAHAKYMRVPVSTLVPLPEELSFTTGAAISCGTGTAYGALRRLQLQGGETDRALWGYQLRNWRPPWEQKLLLSIFPRNA